MKNALCCFLLLVLVFGACFNLPFVAFCCSSLLFLVFEIESILCQKPKQENAFCCCSLWLFVARIGFLWMFPFEHRIARCGFLLVRKTKQATKGKNVQMETRKSHNGQRKAMKSNKSYEEQQKVTTDIGTGKTKMGKKKPRRAKKCTKSPIGNHDDIGLISPDELVSTYQTKVKLQLQDAIYRLRFYSNSLIHILSLSNSHNNVASVQKNWGDKSHRVNVTLG